MLTIAAYQKRSHPEITMAFFIAVKKHEKVVSVVVS